MYLNMIYTLTFQDNSVVFEHVYTAAGKAKLGVNVKRSALPINDSEIQRFFISMKIVVIRLVCILGSFAVLPGCKKSDPVVPGNFTATHHPTFVCQHQPTTASINGQFVIFDLNHTDNKDKAYFIAKLVARGNGFADSCEIVEAPQPIDKLASGWPAEVTSVAFGTTRNILTDAKNAIKSNAGDPWVYAPLLVNTNLYRKLNDPAYAGAMAGKKPFGNNTVSSYYSPPPAYQAYNRLYRDVVYYFKDEVYAENIENGGVKPLSSLFPGITGIDWKTINQTVTVDIEDASTVIRYYKKYYFFDWEGWKYYVVEESQAEARYLSYPVVYYIKFNFKGAQSLDKFCKWPQGWSKP